METSWNGAPDPGEGDDGASVEHSEAEQVIELESDAVHGPLEAALGVEQRVALRRQHRQVLDVPPRQLRTETNVSRDIHWK